MKEGRVGDECGDAPPKFGSRPIDGDAAVLRMMASEQRQPACHFRQLKNKAPALRVRGWFDV